MSFRWFYPAWGPLEAGLAVFVLGSGVWLGVAEFGAQRTERAWRALERQRRAAGSEEIAALAVARERSDHARRQREELAARWESALGARVDVGSVDFAGMERTEAFFELVRLVEGFRRQLREAGIGVKETERFAFETYRTAGPSVAVLAAVVRQQGQVGRLVDAVSAGRALSLEKIEREAPGTEPGEGQGMADFFVPNPRLRLRLPPDLGQGFFRIAFVGETSALRGFLARLAETSPDALVRWIDAVPWVDASESETTPRSRETGPLRFVVTVAFIDWPRADAHDGEVGS